MGSDQSFRNLAEAEAWIADGDFLGGAPVSALYVSSGRDPKPLSLLHPEFLSEQADEVVPAPNFFVYVDINEIEESIVTSFNLDDDDWQTQIRFRDLGYASLKGSPALAPLMAQAKRCCLSSGPKIIGRRITVASGAPWARANSSIGILS